MSDNCLEHNRHRPDGLPAMRAALAELSSSGEPVLTYSTIHRVLAEGSFVLCTSEGAHHGNDPLSEVE